MRPHSESTDEAWRRLILTMGHEINNSLVPIRSIADSLESILEEPSEDWRKEVESGLKIIRRRTEALTRFMASYAHFARLPTPQTSDFDVHGWLDRIASFETRLDVEVVPGRDTSLCGDQDQLDQVLINLVRNAVDAALEMGGGVRLGWTIDLDCIDLWVEDEGPGLANDAQPFVAFHTTKAGGSGIGLALSQQIVEAHGGMISLDDRGEGLGCRASVRLPAHTQ